MTGVHAVLAVNRIAAATAAASEHELTAGAATAHVAADLAGGAAANHAVSITAGLAWCDVIWWSPHDISKCAYTCGGGVAAKAVCLMSVALDS